MRPPWFALLLVGCALASLPVQPISHVRDFGFAGIDCLWDDPLDAQKNSNYLSEVAAFTNVAQLCVFSPDEPLKDRLEAFQAVKVRAVLHLEAVLFRKVPDPAAPSKYRLEFFPDAEERWQRFVQKNGPQLTAERVAALYVADEPLWNGLSQTDLDLALKEVKRSFPNFPTLLIEAAPALNTLRLPPELDLVGFDQYGVPDPVQDAGYQASFKLLKSKLNPLQKLVLVADTRWHPTYKGVALQAADMGKVFTRYLQLAASEPGVVAVLGYIWPGGLDGPEQLGARELPASVQQVYQQFGKQFR
ncbi:hypothetical protein [Deinococcus roseus]|uniref:Uncharacterized protein n=1 Tax=Deinococcus roseus TaxID=392414 RepID=A0ABQ2CYE2_9DEIO|nr:hypothetical protein [Deinococcus roseus]GGJ32877.1 hypothetical protein GCM10008938_18890 [Deinococcus roseus]